MSLPDRAPFSDLSSLIRSVQWPVMPEAGQALIRTLNDEDADTFTVCRIIKKDPMLTTTLLRMANSAMFGLSGSVDTLERAVSVVGLSLVRARLIDVHGPWQQLSPWNGPHGILALQFAVCRLRPVAG